MPDFVKYLNIAGVPAFIGGMALFALAQSVGVVDTTLRIGVSVLLMGLGATMLAQPGTKNRQKVNAKIGDTLVKHEEMVTKLVVAYLAITTILTALAAFSMVVTGFSSTVIVCIMAYAVFGSLFYGLHDIYFKFCVKQRRLQLMLARANPD